MDWQTEIKTLWQALDDTCYVRHDMSCGTYIHISPSTGYDLTTLKSIAKGAIYNDPAVKRIMPRSGERVSGVPATLSRVMC